MRALLRGVAACAAALATACASAQVVGPPRPVAAAVSPQFFVPEPASVDSGAGLNPLRLIGDAAQLLPGSAAGAAVSGGFVPGGPAGPVPPQSGAAERGQRDGFSVALNIVVLLTVLTVAPSIVLMTTCFVRILIVLGLLRQAIGAQSVPPAQVVTGLALMMTAMVMAPTWERVNTEAIGPWQRGEVRDYGELWDRAKQPVRDFMFSQIEATGNWAGVYTMLEYRGVDVSAPERLTRADVDMTVLIPAYILSELRVGFVMGFRVYLPFLVIDMVIASVLVAMSMMTLPPVLLSLPFKLLMFVMVDGWTLVSAGLLESFVVPGDSGAAAALAPWLLLAWPQPRRDEREPALLHAGRGALHRGMARRVRHAARADDVGGPSAAAVAGAWLARRIGGGEGGRRV